MEKNLSKSNSFRKIISWFFKIIGIVTIIFIIVIIVAGIAYKPKPSPMTDEQLQEQAYNDCLESVYKGTGNNKKTLKTGDPTTEERLSMKKFCLCISDIKAAKELAKKKSDKFKEKNKGIEPSNAELDVMEAEVEAERSKLCNKQS